ncbi:echinoderm microtubule-associated protein-like protein 1 [Sarcoptes scabiei]|uniref:Echinoderm microtubule-associated protein-like protein 1 n=1 Tax=Sarcoptes scabiei TaxID=52283 RepID=A0A131ZTJ0_SARSC|nr:echinoderm microtubule-associated protein-like protein 1 [Sarcoptes scabiei]
MNGELDRGISCIAFSKFDGGNLLCVVDESNDHVVSLYEWHKGSNGHKLCESKSSCDSVLAVEFHPIEKNSLITIGRGHIHFWDIDGGILTKKVGSFEKQEKPKYILCMSFTDVGELLTGDSNGNIIIWHKNTCRIIRTIQNAHEGPIFDICSLKNGTFVTGGGKDKRIIEWDSNMNRTGKEAKLPEQYGGVRTLTTGKGSMLIVGSTKNCILQGTMALNFSLVIQGHTEDLFGLAIHPTQNQFITAGHDKNIHLWDTMSHLVVWTKDIGESAHAAAFSPDGCVIVISTTTPGRWIVCDATTKQMLSMHNDGSEIIECFKFSSNGRYLGLGSRDNNVYIYQVTEEYRKFNRIGRCMGHSSFITSIDWDTTNSYIQTTSITCEHLYWNATICRQLANVSISRDLEFETHNSTIGFNVFGVWPENFDGPFVNCLDRSHSKKLLVTGDDLGRLNLFSYPASQSKCLHHSFLGHSNQK